jgi:hypothetical protein
MSLIKKSDVKSHLSTGSGTSVHLHDSLNQPEATPAPADKSAGTQGNAPYPDGPHGGSPSTLTPEIPVERQASSSPATPRNPAS